MTPPCTICGHEINDSTARVLSGGARHPRCDAAVRTAAAHEAAERDAWVRFAAAAAVGISYEPTADAAAEYADEMLAEYRKRWPGGAPPPAAGSTGGRP